MRKHVGFVVMYVLLNKSHRKKGIELKNIKEFRFNTIGLGGVVNTI